jgi:hypothetical protein
MRLYVDAVVVSMYALPSQLGDACAYAFAPQVSRWRMNNEEFLRLVRICVFFWHRIILLGGCIALQLGGACACVKRMRPKSVGWRMHLRVKRMRSKSVGWRMRLRQRIRSKSVGWSMGRMEAYKVVVSNGRALPSQLGGA